MTAFNDKQLQILQTAERLFAEKGFDGTSVRDIARDANINVAMVSYYFGSKEKMLEALILHRTSDLRMQLDNILKLELSPLEKIDRLIELYLARVLKNRCIYRIVNFELTTRNREIDVKSFNEVKKKNLELLGKIIAEGQQKGVFRQDVNVALLPPTILGPFFQIEMNRPLYRDLLALETDDDFDDFIKTTLTRHIQQTIKAFLTYEV
jgi:AcrR family transcriptional regulator